MKKRTKILLTILIGIVVVIMCKIISWVCAQIADSLDLFVGIYLSILPSILVGCIAAYILINIWNLAEPFTPDELEQIKKDIDNFKKEVKNNDRQ